MKLWIVLLTTVSLSTCPPCFSQKMAATFDLAMRRGEITPAGTIALFQGNYMMIGPKFNATFVFNDPNNEGKLSVSYAGAVTVLGLMLGGAFHAGDVGAGTVEALQYIIIVPLLLTNSEHHLFFISRDTLLTASKVYPSVFFGTRTDMFEHWYRVTVEGGVQVDFPLGDSGRFLGFRIGGEQAIIGRGLYDRTGNMFVGLRYTSAI